jgi:hypothetical protein
VPRLGPPSYPPAVLVTSPTQARAVREWLLAALNTDDLGEAITPAPFADAAVFIGERDGPRDYQRWARISTIAIVGRGLTRQHRATDVGAPTQALREHRGEAREWACSVTVCVRLDPTNRTLADEAGQHLQRALGAREGYAVRALADVGMGFLRVADVQDVSRIVGGSEWETRASVVVTWICGWTASTPVEWLDRVVGEGTISGTASLPFDSADGEAWG